MDVGYRAAHASPFNTAAVTPHPGMGTQVHYLEDGTISEQTSSVYTDHLSVVCDAHKTTTIQ